MLNLRPKAARDDEPDLTPLIDMVFILLIFFILAASFAVRGIDLDLPPAHSGQALSGRVVEIRRSGTARSCARAYPWPAPGIRAKLQSLVRDFRARPGQLVLRLRPTRRWRRWSSLWTRCGCRAGKSCSSPRPSPTRRGAHDGKGMPRRRDRRVPVRAFRAADRPEAAQARAVLHHRCPDGHGVPGSGNEPGKGHRHSRRQPARHGQGRCRRPQAAGLPALPRRHRRGRARRRLDGGETGLIGVAEYMFTVRPDGTFTDPVLRASSGSAQLDASARRPSSPPAAKSAAPPSSERNPSPSFCTSNTNTASADRATARQSSRIARRGQGAGLTVQSLFRCASARRQAVPGRGHGGCRA